MIIPEPFGVDRVCVGHRGVYWFEVIAEGRIAHGSMPYLGINAIEGMSHLLDLVRDELGPGAVRARHRDAGGARRLAPRDHQHQRHRRRPAGGRRRRARASPIAAGSCSIAGS